ncbi:MAG: RNA-directed DNA polymerase [Candidatus Cloacimonadaceae bacterium]|nr:RNA-directed DNA polymerase [Candidatus Cloacimonadaceae bacterium]
MKRFGYLYEKIYAWENLLLAYKKARKGKHGEATDDFYYDWERKLYEIQQALESETFRFGSYRQFKIYEPKERLITAAPFCDRVVHHAICNVILPILDKPLIVDSYACRINKGLHKAVKRAFYFYKNTQFHYSLDISKYYYSIDHEILKTLLKKKFKDVKLLNLLFLLIATYSGGAEYYQAFEGDDLFDMIRDRGLPIGNLTSQLWANYYLSGIDHFIREKLHFTNYVRYMDDMLVFGNDRSELKQGRDKIISELSRLRLHINPKKDCIQSNKHGVDFLGFRLFGKRIKIRTQNLVRFRRKLALKSKNPQTDLKKLLRSFNGHLGYLLGGHTKRICNEVLSKIEFRTGNKHWKLVV